MENRTSFLVRTRHLFYVLILFFIFCSCNNNGDYNYVIYMKNGEKVKAWRVLSDGGGLTVHPPFGCSNSHYYLSNNEYTKAVYVGQMSDRENNH